VALPRVAVALPEVLPLVAEAQPLAVAVLPRVAAVALQPRVAAEPSHLEARAGQVALRRLPAAAEYIHRAPGALPAGASRPLPPPLLRLSCGPGPLSRRMPRPAPGS
jgi:hypothetical protein